MTIGSESIKDGPYSGDDSTTSFAYNFKVFADADIRVVLTNTSDVESDLTLDVDYSLSTNADQDASPGGTLTYPLSGDPLATGEKLTIVNEPSFTQSSDLQNQGPWEPQVVEDMVDRNTVLNNRNKEALERSIKLPISTSSSADLTLPEPVANRGIKFNSDASALELTAADPDAAADEAAAAAASAAAAAISETNAGTSETNALGSANDANLWATEDEDVQVNDGVNPVGYSAYHWAQKALANSVVGKGLIDEQIFTSSGTWTKPAGTTMVEVIAVGGGGGGGATNAPTTAGTTNFAGGGGAGATVRQLVTSALGATETVTVGAGGIQGSSGGNGNDGTASSFGAHVTANPGLGGNGQNAAGGGRGSPGAGGTASITASSIGMDGDDGSWGGVDGDDGTGTKTYKIPAGGTSVFEPMGTYKSSDSFTSSWSPGLPMDAVGAGGGGAYTSQGDSNQNGRNGDKGIVIVRSYG